MARPAMTPSTAPPSAASASTSATVATPPLAMTGCPKAWAMAA